MIKRHLLSHLLAHLEKPEILLLVGPRQVGKTFLMRRMQEQLAREGKRTLFFNLDLEDDRAHVATQRDLMEKIMLELGRKTHGYVFIDEIQRKENAGLFLKGIYDAELPHKLIVSGSGSLELKEKIHESLAGRKRVFELPPVSFAEFVNWRTAYRYEEKLPDFFRVEQDMARTLLDEYLTYGGYPRVILADQVSLKRAEIGEIYQSFLERDIKDLLGLVKSESLTHLLKAVGAQIGMLVNYQELASTVGISHKTIRSYLWYLEKTFILNKVTPFFRSVRKELTRRPMFYFVDAGLRNYLLGLFSESAIAVSGGPLFQNFVFHLLRNRREFTSTDIHFWRSRDDAEVDFVIEQGTQLIPVEVKFTTLAKTGVTRSFRNFWERYEPREGYVVHLGERMTLPLGQGVVQFIPVWGFLV